MTIREGRLHQSEFLAAANPDMRLVILDRDGVINQDSPNHIRSVEEWVPIPGSLEAVARLNQAGYRVVVATNQSGIARGFFQLDTLSQIHRKMLRLAVQLGGCIDAVAFCPHLPRDHCRCRKPQPGMFLDLARRLNVSLEGVPAVGDAYRDIIAAQRAGASPVLVLTGSGQKTLQHHRRLEQAVPIFDDLAGFVDYFLSSDLRSPH